MRNVKLASIGMLIQMAIAFPSMANGVMSKAAPHQSIQGTVEFVQRQGIAPGTLKPMNYWSVVVQDHGVRYELSHVFGVESGARPESTTLDGAVIHPGDSVALKGSINKISKDFALVSDVDGVDLKSFK
jgi:hypothetical protein